MHRSVLLLLMSALLLNAAVGLPLSLEESAEKSWRDLLLEDVWESEELLDFSHENSIHKRAAKDSSSSSEEHKDKANNSGASSSEEHKTTTDHAAEESTTQAAARRRRQTITKFSAEYIYVCFEEDATIPEAEPEYLEEYKKEMCPRARAFRDFLIAVARDADPNSGTTEDPINTGNAIHKRAAKDPGSSSEEHKANSSGESSSEEHKTTTQVPVRRRRSDIPPETCGWMTDLIEIRDQPDISFLIQHFETFDTCMSLLREMKLKKEANIHKSEITERLRRQVSDQDQQRMPKASGELELDAQAEKELDEEMARAVADVKDNGSIEDYAQGCEVMEISSKEANEATYAE